MFIGLAKDGQNSLINVEHMQRPDYEAPATGEPYKLVLLKILTSGWLCAVHPTPPPALQLPHLQALASCILLTQFFDLCNKLLTCSL